MQQLQIWLRRFVGVIFCVRSCRPSQGIQRILPVDPLWSRPSRYASVIPSLVPSVVFLVAPVPLLGEDFLSRMILPGVFLPSAMFSSADVFRLFSQASCGGAFEAFVAGVLLRGALWNPVSQAVLIS